jgi:predicted RNase H-like HicB family nuclease
VLKKKAAIIVRVQARLVWEVYHDAAAGKYIGVCRMLNLNAVGETWAELVECASEAMALLFEDLFQEGELEAFLRHYGWHPEVPLPAPGTRARFDIPFAIEEKAHYEELLAAEA